MNPIISSFREVGGHLRGLAGEEVMKRRTLLGSIRDVTAVCKIGSTGKILNLTKGEDPSWLAPRR